jgi:hypothetical protein
MKLTFLCFGSRGDVQPYIALGAGFARRAVADLRRTICARAPLNWAEKFAPRMAFHGQWRLSTLFWHRFSVLSMFSLEDDCDDICCKN